MVNGRATFPGAKDTTAFHMTAGSSFEPEQTTRPGSGYNFSVSGLLFQFGSRSEKCACPLRGCATAMSFGQARFWLQPHPPFVPQRKQTAPAPLRCVERGFATRVTKRTSFGRGSSLALRVSIGGHSCAKSGKNGPFCGSDIDPVLFQPRKGSDTAL